MKGKRLAALTFGGCLVGAMTFGLSTANAVPGQCGNGMGPFASGGGFCDGPAWPDGSFYHCAQVYVFGIGGGGCGQVCPNPDNPAFPPVPTDSDPATPC